MSQRISKTISSISDFVLLGLATCFAMCKMLHILSSIVFSHDKMVSTLFRLAEVRASFSERPRLLRRDWGSRGRCCVLLSVFFGVA